MAEYTVTNLALQVELYRNTQVLYSALCAKYERSLNKDDSDEAIRVLKVCNDLEKALDDTVRDILHGESNYSRVLIDMDTYQQRIDRENDALVDNARLKTITAGLFEILDGIVDEHPVGSGNTGLPPLRGMIEALKKAAKL